MNAPGNRWANGPGGDGSWVYKLMYSVKRVPLACSRRGETQPGKIRVAHWHPLRTGGGSRSERSGRGGITAALGPAGAQSESEDDMTGLGRPEMGRTTTRRAYRKRRLTPGGERRRSKSRLVRRDTGKVEAASSTAEWGWPSAPPLGLVEGSLNGSRTASASWALDPGPFQGNGKAADWNVTPGFAAGS